MTTQTKTFPAGAYSYTIPATLAGSTMQVTVGSVIGVHSTNMVDTLATELGSTRLR